MGWDPGFQALISLSWFWVPPHTFLTELRLPLLKHTGCALCRCIRILRGKKNPVYCVLWKIIRLRKGNETAVVWQGVCILWWVETELNEACRLPGHWQHKAIKGWESSLLIHFILAGCPCLQGDGSRHWDLILLRRNPKWNLRLKARLTQIPWARFN